MRVFAGLPIPEDVIVGLQNSIDFIRGEHRGMSFVKPAAMHITMHFFGEITDSAAKSLVSLMEDPILRIKKIDSSTGEVGKFPKRGNARVLFVGLASGVPEIAGYYALYHSLIGRLGYGPEEREEFVPHITLARNKSERIDENFCARVPLSKRSFFFDRLVLYKSDLMRAGAVHTPLATVMFS